MSRESSPDQFTPETLTDDTPVYRAASASRYLTDDRQHAAPQAFHRRPSDEDGLSFGLTPENAVRGLTRWYGIIRITVGALRALRLRDGDDKELMIVSDRPGHAVIPNIPFHDEDDLPQLAEADTWAEKLADIGELHPEDQIDYRNKKE
jgi:hypothetical protein